jgi:hypothetical protein
MPGGLAAVVGSGLLAVWPLPPADLDGLVDRDELITAALPDLYAHAAEAGVRLHVSTWRLVQAAAVLPGWEHWPGELLVATATVTQEGVHIS